MRSAQVPLARSVLTRIVATFATLALIAGGLSACTTSAPSTASSSVGDDGFSLSIGDLTVSGGPKVAAMGTPVKVELAKKSLANQLPSHYLKSGGSTVKVTLGENEQPKTPIKLRFKVDAQDVPTGQIVFAVLAQSEGSPGLSVLPAKYNAKTGYVTATTPHLTTFDEVMFDLGQLVNNAATFTTTAIGSNFPAPDPDMCATNAALEGAIYSTSAVAGVFPCLSISNSQVKVDLHSTKGIPMSVKPDPAGFKAANDEVTTQIDDLTNRTVAKLGQKLFGNDVLFGGEKLSYSFNNYKPIRSIKVSNAFITMTMLYVAKVFELIILDAVGGGDRAQAAAMLSTVVQCFRDQLTASTAPTKAEMAGLVLKGVAACASGLPEKAGSFNLFGKVGTVIALALLVPSVIANTVNLILDEAFGNKTGDLVIKQLVAPTPSPGAGPTSCAQGFTLMMLARSATGFAILCDRTSDNGADGEQAPGGMTGDYVDYTLRVHEPGFGDHTFDRAEVTGQGVPCAGWSTDSSLACLRGDTYYVNGSDATPTKVWQVTSLIKGPRYDKVP